MDILELGVNCRTRLRVRVVAVSCHIAPEQALLCSHHWQTPTGKRQRWLCPLCPLALPWRRESIFSDHCVLDAPLGVLLILKGTCVGTSSTLIRIHLMAWSIP